MAAPCTTRASSEHKKSITRAISSGFGHFEKSALGMAWRLAGVSKMLGTTELTLMWYGFTSSASESNRASAPALEAAYRDRKSTRLNSSHGYISYAVFCLKKKKNTSDTTRVSSSALRPLRRRITA